jgi:uncharacterized delta-60 repeat protein
VKTSLRRLVPAVVVFVTGVIGVMVSSGPAAARPVGSGSIAAADSISAAPSHAGELDVTFGNRGKLLTSASAYQDKAHALVVQSDGKLVAAGFAGFASGNVALVRYTRRGQLDRSFGTTGVVTTSFGDGQVAEIRALVQQPDGKLVAAGSGYPASDGQDFVLARYNLDGSLDASFGIAGRVVTDIADPGYGDDEAKALAVQADGKLVAAGITDTPTGSDFAMARYNPDGTLDDTFGTAGIVTTDITPYNIDGATALVVQRDGKLVAAGTAVNAAGTNADFALARYNSDGTLDTSFGAAGIVTSDFAGGQDGISELVLQPDSKLAAAGFSDAGPYPTGGDFALARYNIDGTLDTSFGIGGTVTTDFSGSNNTDAARALALQADGKLVAAGITETPAGSDFAVARYNTDGTVDTSFGTGGTVTTDFAGGNDSANAVAVQADGKLVAAGSSSTISPPDENFALARYNPT